MALKVYVRDTKPFTEVLVQAKGIKDNITIGCKCYSNSELDVVRKEFQAALDTTKLTRWTKQLELIKADMSLSDSELDNKLQEFSDKIEAESIRVSNRLADFYRSQVTHIKNASLSLATDGVPTDLLIQDSRNATPIESLWGTPEECLVVLLDTYSDFLPFRDSLHTVIASTIFNYNFEAGQVKN